MTPPRHWQNAAIAVITLAAVLTLSGCNMMQSKTNTTNGTGTQTSAQVGLSASSLDFGNVTVGTTKTLHISLTNSTAAGGASITVSQVKATGTGFSTSSTSNIDLAPGQSTDISVSFKPTASGSVSGNLTIDVIGATDPATVPLNGNGTATTPTGQLSVTAQFAFGNVNVGGSKNLTGTIQATNTDVNISSAAWNGSGYSVSGITFPTTVKAGTSKTFTVTFAPQAAGSASGNLSLTSDAANSPSKATFSGTGVQVAQQHVVNLNWSASTSSVVGYNVYRGTQSGGPYARVNSAVRTVTNYADNTVQSGQVYFYVATAVDSSSAESAYSGEVAAVIPNP
ncbi:MAG TPA: choice-of-anchor D domain-containing protein [Terriglobales bacterium]|jgi:hypothetical protein